ncbi:MAG: DUF2252 family protein [Elusimicrobia bacterium]|nr:DUF2252 family protein [Elusimicrobiota bacterium]
METAALALALKAFIDSAHQELRARRPELLRAKLERAATSDFEFYRGFPNLQYATLKRGAHAEAIGRTASERIAADVHPDNVELVELDGRRVPQVNDFDDSGVAPVGLDLVRGLAGTWFLDEAPEVKRRERLAAAADGYRAALRLGFDAWAESIQEEPAVRAARRRDREWYHRAGVPLKDEGLAGRLAAFAGIPRPEWEPFDRAGAGLSSIGVRRYMFASKSRTDAYELKQLRAAALESFTGKPLGEPDRERVRRGFAELRRVDAEVKTFRFEGSDWSTRRREGAHVQLSHERAESAARVIGGLLAQMHRSRGLPAGRLEEALAVSLPAAEESAKAMAAYRRELARLLAEGTWK